MTAPPARARPVEAGRLLAERYRLEELIASGGMAQVWRGTDEVLRRKVAVKVLHPHLAADHSFVLRFRQEAVAAARLAHPGIVAIYDTCSEDGTEAIVMELVPGQTLRERLDDPTPIDPWQAAGLAAQVAEALDAAHRAGLVHRDVKPANVLLAGDGRIKVADFGIAKAVAEADLTQPGLMVGTAKYVAPEQVEGKPVDARTDIYSLGIVLYEMLCGRPPYVADSEAATALARLQREPLRPRQVRPGVPRSLEEIVGRAMARRPEHRYDSAADLRAALLAAGAAPSPETDLTATSLVPAPPPRAAAERPAHLVDADQPPTTFVPADRAQLARADDPAHRGRRLARHRGPALRALGSGRPDRWREGCDRGHRGSDARGPDRRDGLRPRLRPQRLRRGPARRRRQREPGHRRAGHRRRPATAWRTQGYDNPDITVLKPGVGLVVELEAVKELVELEVDSPTNDWQAEIYVAPEDPGNLADWGAPVASSDTITAGTATFDSDDTDGGAVLDLDHQPG